MNLVKIIPLFTLFLVWGCTDEPTTEQFRTLETVKEYTPDFWGDQTARSLYSSGDTLFVVTADTAGVSALRIINAITGASLGTITSWFNGTDTVTFAEVGTAVTATKERIFVGNKASRVEVFNRQTLAYETTVGTGVWWGNDTFAMVHSFGLGIADSLLLVRDKSNLRMYALSAISPTTKNRVPLFAKSIALSTSTAHHGIAATKRYIYVTDYGLQALLVFSRSAFTQGNFTVTPEDTIALSFRPLGVAIHRDQVLITGEKGSCEFWSQEERTLLRRYSAIEGHTFELPSALSCVDNRLFFVEQSRGSVLEGLITYHDVTVYP